MKFLEAKSSRVFVMRLCVGEIIHEETENFARDRGIHNGYLQVVGGVDTARVLVVGPEDGRGNIYNSYGACVG